MRVIKLDENKIIVSIKFVNNDYELQENELETELGILGQLQQVDGAFIDSPIEESIKEEYLTNEQIQLQTLLNTEYLVTMTQLNNI